MLIAVTLVLCLVCFLCACGSAPDSILVTKKGEDSGVVLLPERIEFIRHNVDKYKFENRAGK